MDSGRFLFNPPACQGNMLYLGKGDPAMRGGRTMISMKDSPIGQPLFRHPDDMFDDDYYDELYPEKKRRLTHGQVQMLEESFEEENKLEPERKTQLAKKLGLQPRQVAVWFQNRRARWKTKQLERDYDLLKASYESLRSNYDSIIKENDILKSEVASLIKKSQVVDGEEATFPKLTPELHPVDNFSKKVEDGPSSGSDTSAVLDENCVQLIDSGDSYFQCNEYQQCIPMINGLQPQDGENDNSNTFFSDVLTAEDQQNHEGVPPVWWVWP